MTFNIVISIEDRKEIIEISRTKINPRHTESIVIVKGIEELKELMEQLQIIVNFLERE